MFACVRLIPEMLLEESAVYNANPMVIDHDKLTRRFCVGCTQYNENIL